MERAELNLYAADINLAHRYLKNDKLGQAQVLLNRHRPARPGQALTNATVRMSNERSESAGGNGIGKAGPARLGVAVPVGSKPDPTPNSSSMNCPPVAGSVSPETAGFWPRDCISAPSICGIWQNTRDSRGDWGRKAPLVSDLPASHQMAGFWPITTWRKGNHRKLWSGILKGRSSTRSCLARTSWACIRLLFCPKHRASSLPG
jgi:hypothetical protein